MSKRDDEDEDLGILPNRIKELRKQKGMTVETLAERAGYSTGHVNNIENHKKGFTPRSLKKIAAALGVRPSELLDTSNAWQEVPVLGYIGEKGIFRPSAVEDTHEPPLVKVPLALGEVIALQVQGNALYPRYDEGATIICARAPTPPEEGVGHECYVVLANGISQIRHLDQGSGEDLYNLTFHNQPPVLNVALMNCRPVLMVIPPK